MRISALLVVLVGISFAAEKANDKKRPDVYAGKLTDFTETRFTGGELVPSISCVDRDYTVDVGGRIIVSRHSTCLPRRDPALKLVVGREVWIVLDRRNDDRADRAGILDAKGKLH